MLPFIPRHDLARVGMRIVIQESDGRHDHARRAVAALHRAAVEERLLNRMQPFAIARPSIVRICLPPTVDSWSRTTRALAVDQDGARAALAFAAAVFAAREAEVVAQDVEQHAPSSASIFFFSPLTCNSVTVDMAESSGHSRYRAWRRNSMRNSQQCLFVCSLWSLANSANDSLDL